MEFAATGFLLIVGGWMAVAGGMLAPWGYLSLAIACATGLSAGLRYRAFEVVITNKRILAGGGSDGQQWFTLPLTQLHSIEIAQGTFGHVFGYGAITVSGTNGARQVLHRIAAPEEFRRIAGQGSWKPF